MVTKISAVVNTRNEEANIRNCLETLRWCDEIILVDMESEDSTVSIAREFTDRIFNHPLVLAFDIAKKFAVEQASGDWILLLDADEMITPQLAEVLKRHAREGIADIVEIPFKHYIMGACVKFSGWGYTPLPRFFKKGKVHFTNIVHDYMHCCDDATVIRLESIDEYCIHHFAYRDSVQFINKLNRYTSIEAQHLFDRQIKFTYSGMLKASFREFMHRYMFGKGYREGVRGVFLSIMMSFYRALTYIKLWELHEYGHESQDEIYMTIKKRVLESWYTSGADMHEMQLFREI